MQELILGKKPVRVVANKYGVNRTTIWRWYKKWQKQNQHIELTNMVRRKDAPTSTFRYDACKWSIPTLSSRPINPYTLSDDIVQLVLDIRRQLNRCAEVVWHHINYVLCIKISLASVRRILERYGRVRKRRKKRKKYKGIKRPNVLAPGDLVETDTIHLYNPVTGKKRYIYTVIDLYSRATYARAYDELKPGLALRTILEAQAQLGISFKVVQSDNGPEFSSYFENKLIGHHINIRHIRLGRPNDNAHIERFNRTIQEECTGSYFISSIKLKDFNTRIDKYIDYYNHYRVHLGISYRTPSEMLHR